MEEENLVNLPPETVRSVSFDPELEDEKIPLKLKNTLFDSEAQAETEDVLTPLPTEKTPEFYAKRGKSKSTSAIQSLRKISSQFSTVSPNDENQERGNWANPVEFLLSILGYAIGLGNIWRFPFLCYRNGGGAFLIPYLNMLMGCGLPLVLMELTLGQYSSEGILTVWKVSPLFKGLGIGMIILNGILDVLWLVITGWSLYYLFLSLRSTLPWQCCEEPWGTKDCVTFDPESCGENMTTYQKPTFGNGSQAAFAADDYFHHQILKISGDIGNLGSVQWDMALALFSGWFIVFVVLCRGIKSLGKVAYFASTFPFVILLILLIRAVIEPGALNGIKYYLTPQWYHLKTAQIWIDAASQVFFSTGACGGAVITLASYNRFKHNLYPDAYAVVFGNGIASFFSGLVCFSILGFMAHNQGASIDDVITSGPGLTFIAYPQAVTILPFTPLWSTLFFFMLSTLALSTAFSVVEIFTTSLVDQFPGLRPFKYFVTMATCFVFSVLGLPLCTNGGMYLLELMNTYGAGYNLLLLGLMEIAVIAWRYGADRLVNNIKHMLDHPPFFFMKYMWMYITPALMVFAVIFTCIMYKPLTYDDYVFPLWANAIGFMLIVVCVTPIPVYAVYKVVSYRKFLQRMGRYLSFVEILQELTLPTEEWGPALKVYQSPSRMRQQERQHAFSAPVA